VNIDTDNAELTDLSSDYWDFHATKMEENNPIEIAAILMTHALTLYKTVLSEEGYNNIVDRISDLRGDVKIINAPPNYYQ
jgi:hypothetical protein